MVGEDTVYCETCDVEYSLAETDECGTMGDLDPETWQTRCCPRCGNRLKTIFVGDES